MKHHFIVKHVDREFGEFSTDIYASYSYVDRKGNLILQDDDRIDIAFFAVGYWLSCIDYERCENEKK
jgi:hypothetical protein